MADDVQRLIRKLQPTGPRSFDEHTWPIYVAVVVLGGYLVGVVLSVLHFDDARWHANALTWISVVTVAVVLAIWSVRYLENGILRRTLVLSLLLSLIVNLSLLVMMAWTSIFHPFWERDDPKAITQRDKPEVIVPEYPLFNTAQEQHVPQEYERPVETGEPEAQERIELTRQAVEAELRPTELLPSPNSLTDERSITKPQRADVPSAPRRSETLAKLSRQQLTAELSISRRPNMTVQPRPPQPAAAPSASLAATPLPSPRQRQLDTPAIPTAEDLAPRSVQRVEIARSSDAATEEIQIASLPILRRQIAEPRNLPRTTTPVDSESTISQRTEATLEPHSTLTSKQTTSAPEQLTTIDLQPKVSKNLDRSPSSVDRPQTDSLSESLARTRISKAASPATDAEVPSLSESQPESSTLDSSAIQIARQDTDAPSESAFNVQVTAQSPELTPSAMAVARSVAESPPSISKTLADIQSLTRAEQVSPQPASTSTDVQNTLESIAPENSPALATEPSRMALTRSSVGFAGVGDASNLERGVAAPDSPVTVASAFANRARSTQDIEQGPSLAPSARSLNRQLRANDDSPRTSLQAQEVNIALVPGASSPAAQAASSAATLEHSPSNAPSASTTAAKGSTEIDLGPTRIAADIGHGRAEGGGQPEISTGEQPRALSRASSIASQSTISTDTEAPEVATPAARNVAMEARDTIASGSEIAQAEVNAVSRGGGQVGKEMTNPKDGEIRIARTSGTRAEDASAEVTPSFAEGGTESTGRSARPLQIRTRTESAVPNLAGSDSSTGSTRGQPLDARGTAPRRSAVGLIVNHSEAVGAVAGEFDVEGVADNTISAPTFARRTDFSGEVGEGIASADRDRGAPRRQPRASLASSSTKVELDPEEFAVNTLSSNIRNDPLDGADAIDTAEPHVLESGGALLVETDAPEAEGGLDEAPALDAGIFSRQAQEESELISLQPARFLRRAKPSAALAARTNVVSPTKAFRRRIVRRGEQLAGERGLPSPKTEAAIELGLVFLSRYQSVDGSWSLNNFADGKARLPSDEQAVMVSDAAATGLSLLAFLGAGYHHRDDKYQETVKGGIDFLVQHQKEDGDLYIDQDANSTRSAWMYSHAIAAIALCEAYGMTQDPGLHGPAQKALNFIVESQHSTRGGWRYSPAYGSDTSVSGWMSMAMKSGELAGLHVPKSAYERLEHWLDLAQDSDARPYLFRYNPYAPDTAQQRHGRQPTRAMTAVGLLMRLYTGWRRDDPNMVLGARILAQNVPEMGTSSRPRRDTYYWYYATQVMYHMGGDYWETWNQKLHPLLAETQITTGELAGSWNPLAPVPDRWGAHGGRIYVTSLNLLSLEVFYRHLPIYEESSK